MYLIYYESQFILRLASLGRVDLLERFQYAFRYMDDLCWLNNGMAQEFLSPEQLRTPDNLFWIYPLQVLEIKCEVHKFSKQDSKIGIEAHFMNLHMRITTQTETTDNYLLCKYDKRRELPFSYMQYISFYSNRPIKQSYAIAVS